MLRLERPRQKTNSSRAGGQQCRRRELDPAQRIGLLRIVSDAIALARSGWRSSTDWSITPRGSRIVARKEVLDDPGGPLRMGDDEEVAVVDQLQIGNSG